MVTRVTPFLGGTGQDNRGKINVHPSLNHVSIGADVLASANLHTYGNSYAVTVEGAATKFANANIYTPNTGINRLDIGNSANLFSIITSTVGTPGSVQLTHSPALNNVYFDFGTMWFRNTSGGTRGAWSNNGLGVGTTVVNSGNVMSIFGNVYIDGNVTVTQTTSLANIIATVEVANTFSANAYYLTKFSGTNINPSNGFAFLNSNVALYAYGTAVEEFDSFGGTISAGNSYFAANGSIGIGTRQTAGANLTIQSSTGSFIRYIRTGNLGDILVQFSGIGNGDTISLQHQPISAITQGYQWQTRSTAGGLVEALTINRNGNVSIGSQSINMSNLSVSGNAFARTYVEAGSGIVIGNAQPSTGTATIAQNLNGTGVMTDFITLKGDNFNGGVNGDGIGIQFRVANANSGFSQARLSAQVASTTGAAVRTDLVLSPSDISSGPKEVLRVATSGVGLWQPNPTANLSVNGNVFANLDVVSANAVSAPIGVFTSGRVGALVISSTGFFTNTTAGQFTFRDSTQTKGGTMDWASTPNTVILYNITGSQYANLQANAMILQGNLAVGTTAKAANISVGTAIVNPLGSLHVSGNGGLIISSAGNASAYDSLRLWYNPNGASNPTLTLDPMTSPGSGIVNTWLRLRNLSTGGNNIIGLLSDGPVMVGYAGSNPSANLQVNGNVSVTADIQGGNDINAASVIRSARMIVGNTVQQIPTGSNLHVYGTMRLQNHAGQDGNEGFHVVAGNGFRSGVIYAASNNYMAIQGDVGNDLTLVGNRNLKLYSYASNAILFYNATNDPSSGATATHTINLTGWGIQTLAPVANLHVNGNAYVTSSVQTQNFYGLNGTTLMGIASFPAGGLMRVTDSSGTLGMIFDVASNPNSLRIRDRNNGYYANLFANSGIFVGEMSIGGNLTAMSKSFLIDHPTKPGKKLQYASLEGPEQGVYVRGVANSNVIMLPDHWLGLVHDTNVTVQLTSVGGFQPLYIMSANNYSVEVGGWNGMEFHYSVHGERKDIGRLEVEF